MVEISTLQKYSSSRTPAANYRGCLGYEDVIERICQLPWTSLSGGELLAVANSYYYFSIQFRENLQIACKLYPNDCKLKELFVEECYTDNLSPWPGVAAAGERLDHDEFMRRALSLQAVPSADYLRLIGTSYLGRVRAVSDLARAKSIASYEDGGLSSVFMAILNAPCWEGAALQAFRFFLEQHVKFDSAIEGGHGALSRHLSPDGSILPLWLAFEDVLTRAAPPLAAARREMVGEWQLSAIKQAG